MRVVIHDYFEGIWIRAHSLASLIALAASRLTHI